MPRKASGENKVSRVHRPQKNGDVYIYEVTTKYNPAKRYNEHVSSKLLGKIPAGETEMVPTRQRRNAKETTASASRKNTGVNDILEWIGRESGIDADLFKSADTATAQKLISIVRFWMANPDKTIRRIEEWQISHEIPYSDGMSEDMCYALMKELGYDISVSQNYFRARAARTPSKASVAVDSTTMYSYSENLNDVRFGYNKDGNGLATVKLLTLFSVKDHQPIAFTRQPGNIPDVSSVKNALKQLSVLGMDKPLVVLDGGYFSESNIFEFIRDGTKFLMRGQLDGKWILPELKKAAIEIEKPSNMCPYDPNIYGCTCRINHNFTRERKHNWGEAKKGEVVTEEHRVYLHFFVNTDKARLDKAALIKDVLNVKEQLEHGVDRALMSKAEQRLIGKFLIIKKYGDKETISINDDAIIDEAKYYGYFVLLSNEKMNTFEALREYQLRERTEEGFRIDKQYNDAHVTRSKTTPSLEGRFFCQFVAYGYEEYFRQALKRLKEGLAVPNGDPIHDDPKNIKKEKALLNWLNKMSVAKLFDWFDAIQETTVNTKAGKTRWKTETIERDRLFLRLLGVIKD